jgi:CDP-paratose 2-epimerase
MKRAPRRNGKPKHKSLARSARMIASTSTGREAPVLITGGAGFIGTNLAHHFLSHGRPVILYDNLSRNGVDRNLAWLRQQYRELLQIEIGGVQDIRRLRQVVRRTSEVFHFAAQVAVTTSLEDPIADFEVNARGTLNLLEAVRQQPVPPKLLFTSTNKVYGHLNNVPLRSTNSRYEPEDQELRTSGFDEGRPLDFHSPYGCSKGAAEQYVLDYSRTFGLQTVVFRMSCIYGPHQFGTEDQGWVAHFLIRTLEDRPITLYGDGRQVRDILFVDDLVQALLLALERIDAVAGQAFNIGGGPHNTISLLELLEQIAALHGKHPDVRFDQWRPADQQYYVSDIRKFSTATGWVPRVSAPEGIKRLYRWLREFRRVSELKTIVIPAPLPETKVRNGTAVLAKMGPNVFETSGQEPRSKRIWKTATVPPLSGKIIKFP